MAEKLGERLLRLGRAVQSLDRHGSDQRRLVTERPEERALRDAGGLRQLAGGDVVAALRHQREHRVHDGRLAILRSHAGCPRPYAVHAADSK